MGSRVEAQSWHGERMDGRSEPRLIPARLMPRRGAARVVDPAERPIVAGGRTASRGSRQRFSSLTRRILFMNLAGPALLAIGLLYLDDYRRGLIEAQFASLTTQARIIATALSEAAAGDEDAGSGLDFRLSPELLRPILLRLIEPTNSHGRVFAHDGALIADSRVRGSVSGAVIIEMLAPPVAAPHPLSALADAAYDLVMNWLPARRALDPWPRSVESHVDDFPEVAIALLGDTASTLRAADDRGMMFSVAVPVQRFKQVLGALHLSTDSKHVDASLRAVRFDVLKLFTATVLLTALVSLYLAGTIARPIRLLALAAERVRRGHGLGGSRAAAAATPAIPDMRARGDEIGELSGALADMTSALWQRLDAIERFAADVSHEIKNPLTSLKSAVETASRVEDPAQRERLMQIIVDDVQRIDRLIADISGASRLDAELSRAHSEPVDVATLLRMMADVHEATAEAGSPKLIVEIAPETRLVVQGIEDRLGQVLRNLIGNAASFSPAGGTIRLTAQRDGDHVDIAVEDDGPGIPEDKLEAIFDRFYSERPKGEKFGTHSGLGLSISRQIALAHGGAIWAENRHHPDGQIAGARFILRLPTE
jgi:two-component system sensor histidine kinase ChvG